MPRARRDANRKSEVTFGEELEPKEDQPVGDVGHRKLISISIACCIDEKLGRRDDFRGGHAVRKRSARGDRCQAPIARARERETACQAVAVELSARVRSEGAAESVLP